MPSIMTAERVVWDGRDKTGRLGRGEQERILTDGVATEFSVAEVCADRAGRAEEIAESAEDVGEHAEGAF